MFSQSILFLVVHLVMFHVLCGRDQVSYMIQSHELPRVKLDGNLPSLRASISSDKSSKIMKILDTLSSKAVESRDEVIEEAVEEVDTAGGSKAEEGAEEETEQGPSEESTSKALAKSLLVSFSIPEVCGDVVFIGSVSPLVHAVKIRPFADFCGQVTLLFREENTQNADCEDIDEQDIVFLLLKVRMRSCSRYLFSHDFYYLLYLG